MMEYGEDLKLLTLQLKFNWNLRNFTSRRRTGFAVWIVFNFYIVPKNNLIDLEIPEI